MRSSAWARNSLRHIDWCQRVHVPSYQSDGLPGRFLSLSPRGSSFSIKKLWNGAVKTAATSFASRRGIRDTSGSADFPVDSSWACKSATQGRTTSSVCARCVGNSQRCSTRKGGGKEESLLGRPISSCASRRAVLNGVSDTESALPVTVSAMASLTEFARLVFTSRESSLARICVGDVNKVLFFVPRNYLTRT